MAQPKTLMLAAALVLATALTLSCSDGGSTAEPIRKAKISGLTQKGPFVEGSTATLYELNDRLEQTGRSFRDIIADSRGSFEIRNVELASPYAMLEASGYYRNENTGDISKAPITLFAIADVREKDNINVNILTHLEYYRVIDLAESEGRSIKDAKKQAQKEILAVFGIDSDSFKDSEDMSIFGTGESDAALLAISVLLQGDLSEGEFSQRLTNFAQSLKASGTWGNEAEKNKIADWAEAVDLSGIMENILNWNLSPAVPDFEKFANDYWHVNYGLGACDASLQSNVKNSNRGIDFVCKNGNWQTMRYVDIKCFESKSCLTFADARDNQLYYYVAIGEQVWMAENLNYGGENGTSGICYGNDQKNCSTYGRLYDWETAMNSCPSGWHLPSKEEWEELVDFAGEEKLAGKNLKAKDGWNPVRPDIYYGLDSYGFAALPGGNFAEKTIGNGINIFDGIGMFSDWWGSTENDDNNAYRLGMYTGMDKVNIQIKSDKSNSYYVRCVKD